MIGLGRQNHKQHTAMPPLPPVKRLPGPLDGELPAVMPFSF